MDGFALLESPDADVRGQRFEIVAESAAGHPYTGTLRSGQCVRVYTGAAVPDDCLRVVLQEDCAYEGTQMHITGQPDARSNLRPVGQDVPEGAVLVKKGQVLSAFDIGRLAASGLHQPTVYARRRIGIFSTGDELRDPSVPHEALQPGQIYESNRQTLAASAASVPCEVTDLGNLPDDPAITREAISDAADHHDVLLTSGGVSVGDHDHVRTVLEALGSLDFWRLNLKPGKPLAFGHIDRNDHRCWFFGLPGNPVSTIVTWLLVAKPALMHLCGAEASHPTRLSATLRTPVAHRPGRAEYQRGRLVTHPQTGALEIEKDQDQSSNRLATFATANCLFEVPKEAGDLPAGAQVSVLLLAWL